MKKILSLLISMVIVGAICAGAAMLCGCFSTDEVIQLGLSAATGGVLGPIVAAAVSKWLKGYRQKRA